MLSHIKKEAESCQVPKLSYAELEYIYIYIICTILLNILCTFHSIKASRNLYSFLLTQTHCNLLWENNFTSLYKNIYIIPCVSKMYSVLRVNFEAVTFLTSEMSVFPDSQDPNNSSSTLFVCFYGLKNKWK